jgi:leader peptidase (prepilin peptidase)/N-methyltransferase
MDTIAFIEETTPWFFPTLVFVFGACIGSFLNVCIYRMPKGESILWPPSHSSTGRQLSWWENIPILAWIYLGGKDRETGERYGIRYPMVELMTAILFVACWWLYPPIESLVWMLFVTILIVCTFIDLDHMILPDTFTIGGMIVAVLISFWLPSLHFGTSLEAYVFPGFAAGVYAIMCVFIGSGLVYWIGELGEVVFRKPAMGLGDVKLVGCIAAFCGWQGALFSIFGGAIIGSVLLIPIMLIRSFSRKQTIGNSDDEGSESEPVGFGIEVPFGPLIAVGGLSYVLGLNNPVDAYFEMVKSIIFHSIR